MARRGPGREEASEMPAAIILSSVISSWPILWAGFAGGAVVVILISAIFAIATNGRHGASHQRHAVRPPSSAQVTRTDQHALA